MHVKKISDVQTWSEAPQTLGNLIQDGGARSNPTHPSVSGQDDGERPPGGTTHTVIIQVLANVCAN